jgi:hypothetical protein
VNTLKTVFCEKKDCILRQQVAGMRRSDALFTRFWKRV